MTLRQLAFMSECRQKTDWLRTSALMALMANLAPFGKRTKTYTAADFDPFAPKPKPIMISFGLLFQAQKGGTAAGELLKRSAISKKSV